MQKFSVVLFLRVNNTMKDKKLTPEDHKLWELVTKDVTPLDQSSTPSYIMPPIPTKKQVVNNIVDFNEPNRSKNKNTNRYQAILDLHGMTRDEAHKALETFLCTQKIKGAKCVLVITGKGHGKGEGLGILKRKVPLWIESSKIAKYSLPAAPKDGGDGALYVYLK